MRQISTYAKLKVRGALVSQWSSGVLQTGEGVLWVVGEGGGNTSAQDIHADQERTADSRP
jgi:hypothetical protein